ncbi:MAG: DNA primase [Treponema sp.]|nr:DNA primase [Treponema sp.]
MALISKTSIAEVSSRLDAVSVVGDYVRLEKKGGRWWGKCPFHGGGQEKTPSFKVDPDSKMYYCFGCSKGGSVISFVMEMEKISYPEAIKTLAKKTGIELVMEEGSGAETENDTSAKEELYELYKRTTVTFKHFLLEKPEGKAALNYIKERGISDRMIEQFNLGYAPSDRDFLYKFLQQKGYSDQFLEKSGLFSSKYKKLPLFSGRLMFPISDLQGRIVAFGGRAMPTALQSDKESPKYINSPETGIYNKGQVLFAIDLAKPEMRQSKTVYLAEGYMDVIALHEAGISNAVAPLGTAFTDSQVSLLNRWVEKIVLIFDNDEAGHKAAYKSIIACRKGKIPSCSLSNLQEGLKREIIGEETGKFKDPAEILQKFGPNVLKNILKFTINDFEYLIFRGRLQNASADGNVNINKAVEFMFPYLDSLDSEIDRDDCITRIADIYKIERGAVKNDYSRKKSKTYRELDDKTEAQKPKLQIKRNDELSLLTNVAVNQQLYADFRKALEIKEIDDPAAKEIFIALEECFKHDENGIDSLLSRIEDDDLRNYIADRGTSGEYSGDARRFMEDGIKKIKIKRLEKRITEINAQMREDERKSFDFLNIDELLAEKKYIDSQILKLKDK